jgi:HEAT repeat protein
MDEGNELQERIQELIMIFTVDESVEARTKAMTELGKIGELAIPQLLNALKNSFWKVRHEAAWGLENVAQKVNQEGIVKKIVQNLVPRLLDENQSVRAKTASSLEVIKHQDSVEPLIRALENEKDETVIGYEIGALGVIGGQMAVDWLIRALKNEEFTIRLKAVIALRHTTYPKAKEALRRALNDEVGIVREFAVTSLGENIDPGLIDTLVALLKKENNANVLEVTVETLVKFGEQIVPIFIDILEQNDSNDELRGYIAKGLGQIGEPAISEFNRLYLEGKVSHELAEVFFSELERKVNSTHFDNGCVAPPKKAPKNPDEMKRMLLKRISQSSRPKTQDRKRRLRGVAGG